MQSACITQLNSTNLKVTCTFAINAPAGSGCWVEFDNAMFDSFNYVLPYSHGGPLLSSKTVQIPQNILKQANKLEIFSVEFVVRVYDINENHNLVVNSPAVEQVKVLQMGLPSPEPNIVMSLATKGMYIHIAFVHVALYM